MRFIFPVTLLFLLASCRVEPTAGQPANGNSFNQGAAVGDCPLAKNFNFPVGPPDARGYFNAQPFGKNNHLGEDWNGVGGGNSDLGGPVYAIAAGRVVFAQNIAGGWGNVVRLCHNIGTDQSPVLIESLYAHLDRIDVREGQKLHIGEQLGTIGDAGGRYSAHLHLELRDIFGMPVGGGYSENRTGYIEPTAFIKKHQQKRPRARP